MSSTESDAADTRTMQLCPPVPQNLTKNSQESTCPESSITMPAIDRMTMELLLNKTHYAKYLSKTDAQKHEEYRQFVEQMRAQAPVIEDITSRLLQNPKSAQFSQDVSDSFQQYAQAVLRFLELQPDAADEGEEDEMFPASMNEPFRHIKKKPAANMNPTTTSSRRRTTMDFFA